MIYVLNDGSGRLCNKLIFAANILSSCIEKENKIIYYNYPFSWVQNKENQYIVPRKKLNKYVDFIIDYFLRKFTKKKIAGYEVIYKQSVFETNATLSEGYKDVIWYGWPYFDLLNLRKHKLEVQEYFRFPEETELAVNNFFENISGYDYIIGVHIRRDDYKEWRGGKYYYDNVVYLHYMQECQRILGKNIVFILFSDESLDSSAFKEYNIHKAAGTVLEDLCSMSKCDFLIGPPSTFSGWASFYGDVPRYIIEEKSEKLDKENFKVWLTETDEWTVTE